jgi:RsiW-degrading membrane proteinase PrsW (M82 family)
MDNRLMALAIIPGLLIIIYVYTKDRVEKEPISLIIRLVILGGLSTIAAIFLETAMTQILPQYPQGTVEYAVINAFAIAALCEEFVKYFALKIGSWRNPAFNYRFDGVVYGVSAAVGFAILENIGYVAQYGLQTAYVRAFTAVPLHAFCGLFMGVFYSYARKAYITRRGSVLGYKILALIIPMLIHGIYDTLAFIGTEEASYMLLAFVVFLYIVAIISIRFLSAADY